MPRIRRKAPSSAAVGRCREFFAKNCPKHPNSGGLREWLPGAQARAGKPGSSAGHTASPRIVVPACWRLRVVWALGGSRESVGRRENREGCRGPQREGWEARMGAAQSAAAKEPSEGVARHCQSEFERLCPKERDYLVLTGGRETSSQWAEFGYACQCC